MNIVAACNDHYAKYLRTMLTSLLENTQVSNLTTIYIIDGNISNKNKKILNRIANHYKSNIIYLQVTDKESAKYFKRNKYISKEAYYRILIPQLLDSSINKAIYLDCDLLVEEDIYLLWNMNMNEFFLAAVESANSEKRRKSISLPKGAKYFNSGVMVMDLQKWRSNGVTEQVLQYIKNHASKKSMLDQHALNAILYNKWLKLNIKWNFTKGYWKKKRHIKPAIIHFTGSEKPWNSNHLYKKEYMMYRKKWLKIIKS